MKLPKSLRPKTLHPNQKIQRFKLFPGDLVEVINGKHKGERGKVIEVIEKLNRITVEKVAMQTKHVKPNSYYPKGGRIMREQSIPYASVQLVDPQTDKPTSCDLVWTKMTPNEPNKLFRKLNGTLLPVPPKEDPFKKQNETVRDTPLDLVRKVTFQPDIMVNPFPPEFLNELERMKRKNRENQAL